MFKVSLQDLGAEPPLRCSLALIGPILVAKATLECLHEAVVIFISGDQSR